MQVEWKEECRLFCWKGTEMEKMEDAAEKIDWAEDDGDDDKDGD